VQENHSRNLTRHTVRGLHFQRPPHGETKLVRCVRGAIFDVFVDLRAGSPTFGHWESIVLSEDEPTMVLVPKGFAHGYATLTDRTDVLYKVDHPYHPESEGGLFWNDPAVGITWPRMEAPVISPKDAAQPDLAAFRKQWGDLGAH
jgi:dTDP-4-dehydrorhamnose 3,5-epimerase